MIRLVSMFLVACMLVAPARAAKRVALVIGNAAYVHSPPLQNPVRDAELIAAAARACSFELTGERVYKDLDKPGFDAAVQQFGAALAGAEVGLFYYSGHGVQVRGSNYLMPVTANLAREVDVDFQALDAGAILRQMESAGTKLNIVILDACRNNPFASRGLRSASSGLAQMQAPEGTLISFATQPGNVALDGSGGNSPYAAALARTMRRPDLGLFDAFNEVGLLVKKHTGGAQQPWLSSSPIAGQFRFAAAAPRRFRRFQLQGTISGRTIEAELVRTADDGWEWTEREGRWRFRTVSESDGEVLIVDDTRAMYHRLDLKAGKETWRIGTSGGWNTHYDIVSIE